MLKTLRLSASNPEHITRAAELLRAGGTVAFPTETVYGLGANALSATAVAGIFTAKQRPSWDPLIVHVATHSDALEFITLDAEGTRRVDALAHAFWPGPLTLLLPRRASIPDAVTAGRALVGLRVPAHPAAQALLRAARLPLAAPSANLFGHTSPTTAQHVLDDLDGRIDAVLDGGSATIGLESTVLDPISTPMIVYRPGALTLQQIAAAAGVPANAYQPGPKTEAAGVASKTSSQAGLPAPGVGLRHYAPHARLVLVEGNRGSLNAALAQHQERGETVGVLLPEDWTLEGRRLVRLLVEPWAPWRDSGRLASTLFAGLRSLDARSAEIIYCPLPEPGGLNDAIRDRLQKASRSS